MGNNPPCGGSRGFYDALSTAKCPPGYTVTAAGYMVGSQCTSGTQTSLAALQPWGTGVLAWPVDNYNSTIVAIAQCSN